MKQDTLAVAPQFASQYAPAMTSAASPTPQDIDNAGIRRQTAGVMSTTLLLAWSGQTFALSSTPIWVRPVATALSVRQSGAAA